MTMFYLAIEPPRDVATRIAGVMELLGDRSPIPHVTVRAPAELSAQVGWLPRVREAAARATAFAVTIGHLGTFGDRVLYLTIESAGLLSLRQDVLGAFGSGHELTGESLDDRPFVPHLTVCVARGRRSLPPYEDLVAPLRSLPPFDVVGLTVFRRENLSSPYRAWKRLPLANPGPRPPT
jgi:2'-5' RNA ligase